MKTLQNIQFQQFINLLLLVIVAFIHSKIQTTWSTIIILAIFASAIELGFSYHYRNKVFFPYSAIITSFGIILMIGWTQWYIPYILTALALSQKWLLKIDKGHLFNPSNLAVVLALAIFYPKALPIIGQLGREGYLTIIAIIALAIAILIRVNRIIIPIAFVLSYVTLEYLLIGSTDPHWKIDDFITTFYSTSFIVYIFFMLTDPRVTPDNSYMQILFGLFVALFVAFLDYINGVHLRNLFIAVFFMSPAFVPLYRQMNGKDFQKYLFVLILCVIIVVYVLSQSSRYFSM